MARELGRDYQAVHGDVVLLRDTGLLNKDQYGRIYVPWTRLTTDIALDDAAEAQASEVGHFRP